MWRRPLNSVALATITHRKPKKVSDGTDTQVKAQMINKCRIKMVQKETLHEEGIEKIEKEYYSNQNCTCTQSLLIYMENLPPRTGNSLNFMFLVFA